MIDLSVRSLAEEQMDAPGLSPATYDAVLADLARVNRITMAARPTIGFLDRIATRGNRLRILDVGFGQGDMLRRISDWGRRSGVVLDLVGIDLNPRSAPAARAATPARLNIDYRTGDYADFGGEQWDVILSSLVAHHMSRTQLVAFLRFMEAQAARGWLINDLHRHRFAHAGYPLLARSIRAHRIVREDGTLSIARAYRPSEWPSLLDEADVQGAQVKRRFPFRLCVERCR